MVLEYTILHLALDYITLFSLYFGQNMIGHYTKSFVVQS